MIRARNLAVGALILALGCNATDTTQIVVALDTDLSVPLEVDSLHIEVEGPGGTRETVDVDLTTQTDRPLTLGLRPATDALEPVRIHASARLGATIVVERVIVTGFIKDKSLLLRIWLRASCQGVSCPSGQSCDDATCVANAVNATTLPAFTGSVMDGGTSTADGGGDSCSGAAEICNGADDDCDGTIDNGFDLTTDTNNCGSCGHACASLTGVASATCAAGRCVVTCDSGFDDCDADPDNGCESNLNTDAAHCSTCDNACAFDHAAAGCAGGSCTFGACADGFADCDLDELNGCEADLTDATTCGRCGHDCVAATCEASGFCEDEEIVGIAAGSQHSCALRANGSITCWGLGAKGQLGTGANSSSRVPLPVMGITDAVRLSAGGDQACAIDSTSPACWGDNSRGQLGDGTVMPRNVPTRIALGMGTFRAEQIAMGSAHGCILGATSGPVQVRCWGTNNNGQLGVGDTMDHLTPLLVDSSGSALVEPILVAASGRHTCAALADGHVYCWGAGTDGQLGVGSRADEHLPVQVLSSGGSMTPLSLSTGTPVTAEDVSLVEGNAFTCARDDGGQVYCWGDNSRGQLGEGTMVARRTFPVAVMGLSDAVTMSAGDAHACALRGDGRVSCWGANGFGQLGNGMTVDSSVPVDVMDVPPNVVEIAAGAAHVCLRTAEGHVYCYGSNSVGQLGDGTLVAHATPEGVSTLH